LYDIQTTNVTLVLVMLLEKHLSRGELSCSVLPPALAKSFFAISKWRMASSVLPKTFRNHNNLNCDKIFRAKCQLSLIPLNRTAALSNLTHPRQADTITRMTARTRLPGTYRKTEKRIVDKAGERWQCHYNDLL